MRSFIPHVPVLKSMNAMTRAVESASHPRHPRSRPAICRVERTHLTPMVTVAVAIFMVVSMAIGGDFAKEVAQTGPWTALITLGPNNGLHSDEGLVSNVSYCGVLGPDPGNASDISIQYQPNVSKLWYHLCVRADFITAINSWGDLTWTNATEAIPGYWAAQNLTIGGSNISDRNGSNNPWIPAPKANFVVSWTAACDNLTHGPSGAFCPFLEHWEGNVSTYLITGPFFIEAGCGCQSNGTPIGGGGGRTSGPAPTVFSDSNLLTIGLIVAIGSITAVAVAVAVRGRKSPPSSPESSVPSLTGTPRGTAVSQPMPGASRGSARSPAPQPREVDPLEDVL